jgi:SAM-dependent methyltransferase
MIEIARRGVIKKNLDKSIRFICSDIMDFDDNGGFDVVLANFFLNTFQWNDAVRVLRHISGMVRPEGILCIADEVKGLKIATRFSQMTLRPFIIWIHKLWANQPFHPIYDYEPTLSAIGFEKKEQKRDVSDYIISTVYAKSQAQ